MSRVSLNTLINRSNNNMDSGTHPVVRESALEVIIRAYQEGINVQISEGNRSYARQNALYAQGRSKPGNIVTNARGGQSWHNFGIAVDFFLTNNSGSKGLWSVNSKWRRAAQIGKSLGFEWGGDWSSFKDYPHLQMTGGLSLAQMRAGRRPSLKSKVNKPIIPTKPKPSGKLRIDGYWGAATTRKLQKALGTYQDGIISKPSKIIKELQRLVGARMDGYLGTETYRLLQRYLGTPEDGKLSKPSSMVKELQRRLNAGTIKQKRKGKKSVHQMAVEIINKQHGTGHTKRRASLNISKSEYNKVKKEVNRLAAKKPSKPSASKWKHVSGGFTGQGLERGMEGEPVRELSQLLANRYFYPEKGAKNNGVDKYFGPKLESTLKRYQGSKGLKQDGIAGAAVHRAIHR